jgi:hypothetical protein
MQNERAGVAIGDATIDTLMPHPDALALVVALIRVHGCQPTFRLDGRMGALMLSGKCFGFALRVLIQHGFVVLIERGVGDKSPLLGWPETRPEAGPPGVSAPAGSAAAAVRWGRLPDTADCKAPLEILQSYGFRPPPLPMVERVQCAATRPRPR